MSNLIEAEHFSKPFFSVLEETFDRHHGIFLDANTSLIETLDTISAQQASIPVGGGCATLAAQVAHIIFYLEVLERYVTRNDGAHADWGEIWRRVGAVSQAEWDELRENLKQARARIERMFRENEPWHEESIGGALAVLVHTAYHLGEIRQALCVLKELPG